MLNLIRSILSAHGVDSPLIPKDYRRMVERVSGITTYSRKVVNVDINVSNLHWTLRDIPNVKLTYVCSMHIACF